MPDRPDSRPVVGFVLGSLVLHVLLVAAGWMVSRTGQRSSPGRPIVLSWQPVSPEGGGLQTPAPPPDIPVRPVPEVHPPSSTLPAERAAIPSAPAPAPAVREDWARALDLQGTPPRFFGKLFGGGSVVFVIDISGSMLARTASGTRLTEAYQGLMKAVGALQPGQKFNIILFADRVDVFRPAPVPAETAAKLESFAYLDSEVDCGGSTNLQEALRRALAMKPDVILLLGDGEANTEDAAILAETRHLRERHAPQLVLHTVGFYLQPGARSESLLRRLAEENGGTYAAWNPRTGAAVP